MNRLRNQLLPRKFFLTVSKGSTVERVFQSLREVAETHGMVVVMDLCKHPFEEFREEIGEMHVDLSRDQSGKWLRGFRE